MQRADPPAGKSPAPPRFWRRAGLLPLALAAACGRDEPPPRPAATFVGRAACARCHPAEAEAWTGSHHDLAMQEANPQTVLGDFGGVTAEHAGVTTSFSRRDGRYLVRTDGPDGELHDYEVRYTFGVAPLQQYLVELDRGRLQALPFAWDSRPADAGGQRWFHLYPGERIDHRDPLHWTRPLQNWNAMCADCHSTNLQKGYDPESDRYATTWSEIDVSCEACHGPGSRHVAWTEAGDRDPQDPGLELRLPPPPVWQFQPGEPTAKRRQPPAFRVEVETCGRCHSRRTTLHEPYRHGRPLLDSHRVSLLDEGSYFADGQIRDEVYVYGSFLQSRMYAAGVSCSDCHEPHSLSLRAPGNELCARCHQAAHFDTPDHHFHQPGTPGSACVDCHMPARTYMVVDPRRDHSLRVPRPDLTVKIGTPNACNGCHDDRSARWAADEIAKRYPERPRHYGETLAAGRRGGGAAAPALLELASDPEVPAIARATALSLLAGGLQAPDAAALRLCLADGEGLVRLGALLALDRAPPEPRAEAVPLLRDPLRMVRIEAGRLLADHPDEALGAGDRAARDAALAEYVAAQRVQADRGWAHVNLGLLAERLGRSEEAESEYRRALTLDPGETRAFVNLADLYRAQGRDAEGETVLRSALETAGDRAAIHHALGLLLVRRQRPDEALDHLRRAAQARPDNPRYSYVYGVALYSQGRSDEALAVLEEAWQRSPAERDLLAALASYCLELERYDQARRWLAEWQRRHPGDRAAQALQQELLLRSRR